jgi:hypothetical protein
LKVFHKRVGLGAGQVLLASASWQYTDANCERGYGFLGANDGGVTQVHNVPVLQYDGIWILKAGKELFQSGASRIGEN